jgi:hypothetical protein
MRLYGALWKTAEFHVDEDERKSIKTGIKRDKLIKWITYSFMDTSPLPLGFYC